MYDNEILRIPSQTISTFVKKHMTVCNSIYKQSTDI